MIETTGDQSRATDATEGSRLVAIDALRGLIMVLMALDHANYFVAQKHSPGEYWGGAFPVWYSTTSFLARLATHPAAPGFCLLMGVGMALFARSRLARGWSKWTITRHLMIRGVLLIALQLLVVNRAWELSPQGWGVTLYIGVLVALGAGMILGSLLLWLKPPYLLGLAGALLVGIELLIPAAGRWGPNFSTVTSVMLIPGGRDGWWVNYPILQWLELVVFGLAFGQWLAQDRQQAFNRAWKLGLAFLLAFALLRTLDGFGNIRPRMGNTWIDFLNPVKYPPSITFTLMTTGLNLVLLWVFSRARLVARRLLEPLAVLGRAPLFFYLLHLFLYAALGYALVPRGTTVPAMLPFWLLGLVILLPLCFWFGRIKQRQPVTSILRFL